jgi:hypothetical protein
MSIWINKEEKCAGQVLDVHGEDIRIMSDVWDWIQVATILNYNGTYERIFCDRGVVDTAPEQISAWKAKVESDRVEAEVRVREEAARIEAARIGYGKKVKVVAGRTVAHGTIGRVFWMKEKLFGCNRTVKIGIALDDAKDEKGRNINVAWTYARNVVVVQA